MDRVPVGIPPLVRTTKSTLAPRPYASLGRFCFSGPLLSGPGAHAGHDRLHHVKQHHNHVHARAYADGRSELSQPGEQCVRSL